MTTDIVVPAEQEGTKAVLKNWLKALGDSVRVDEPLVEIETDKVAVEIAATADGVLAEILVDAGADIEPGTVIGRIAESAAPVEESDAGERRDRNTPPSARPGRTRHIFLQESAVSWRNTILIRTQYRSAATGSHATTSKPEIARRATATKPAGVGVTVVAARFHAPAHRRSYGAIAAGPRRT